MNLPARGGGGASDRLAAVIASRLARSPLQDLRLGIGAALEAVGRRISADRVTLWDLRPGGDEAALLQAWSRVGCGPPVPAFPASNLPWLMREALEGRTVAFRSVAALPREASRERRVLARHGPRSAAVIPVVVGGVTVAALVVGTIRRERTWRVPSLAFLEEVAVALGGALGRQRAQDASLELEGRLAAVLDAAADGILLVRPDGTIELANGRAGEIFLRTCEELRGVHLQDLLATAAEGPRPIRTRIDALLARSDPADLDARRGDGSTAPVAVTVRPVRSQGVELSCVLVRDLTAAHRARDEAARLRNELAFMGRTALVAEMGAGVAHELNQPLTAILSNAETAARLVRSGRRRDRAELTETLGDVVADTRRAADVIGRMRDMLRRRPMERIPVDVAALLASVARRFRERAVARAVRLTVEVAPGLPRVAGDPVQLEQVVTNLVLNALEALGEARGGGERAIAVRARAAEPGGVDVSVRDSGPGLGDDALAHAFDAFFTTKPGGLGMGLGISRSIVDAHGGRLLARNNAGGGATFEFHLPAAPPLAASRIRRRPA